MSLHKLTAGDGYTYLTRQVAAHDATSRGYAGLGEYYASKGESPGVWVCRGCSAVPGFRAAGPVTEAQMRALFGEGRHPDADRLSREMAAAGHGPAAIEAATRLGAPFRVYDGGSEFRRRLAEQFAAWNADAGLPRDWPVPPAERARIRTEVATGMFSAEFDRPPADARELSGFVARVSRQPTTAVAGYDLTFSPVKSVSALWALAPREVAERIEAAHTAAVADTLTWLESAATFTRTGRNGVAQVEVAGLIAAAFTHRDSRAGDPDLHTHVAISNKVRTADGRWLALDGRPLHKMAVAASERYNTRLEARLRAELGVRFTERPDRDPTKRPVREIDGIPPELLTAWSSRRVAIDTRRAELAARFHGEHGRTPTVIEALKLAQRATLETRQAKHEPRTLAEQRAAWRAQATAALGGEQPLAGMLKAALQPRGPAPIRPDWRPAEVTAAAERVLATVSAARATWQQNHLRAEAERVVRTAGTRLSRLDEVVEAVLAAALSPARSVPLDAPDSLREPAALRRSDGTSVYEVAGAQLYTSPAILTAEERILTAARRRDGRVVPALTVELALTESAANGVALNPGQAQLVRELATSGARVQLALAPAGTGKTTAMAVLTRAWADSGGTVIGLAPSAAAAAVLGAEIGARTDTLAKLLHAVGSADGGAEPPGWVAGIGPGSLVLLDEAGMAGTADLAAAVDYVLGRGGSVRLVGDDQQLAAIGAGGVLRDVAETTGAVALSQVMRFTDPAEAAALLALRAGNPAAIGFYLDRGRVHVGDPGTVAESAYRAWAADRTAGRDALLLAPTRQLVGQLNARARADRLTVDGPPGLEVQLGDGSSVSAGDPIVTGRNDRRIGITATDWVKNGDRWRVAAVHPDGSLRVTHLPTGRRVNLPAGYVAEHVSLGYATTVHAAQGVTAEVCHTVATGAETRQLLYVALSRGRHGNHLYLATGSDGDPHAVITRDALLPPTAADVLTRVLRYDGAQTSATTTGRDLQNPTRRLAQAADRYYDAVTTAAELHLGPAWTAEMDTAAERLLPGLPTAPAYPTLRTHLALLALTGDDPAELLRDAIAERDLHDAADAAAVLDWRLPPAGGAADGGGGGPLRWLPAIPPALAEDPGWAGYLTRRTEQVEALAAAVAEVTRGWTPSSAPGWAQPLQLRDPQLLVDLAVWRAAHGVGEADPTLTGPPRRPAAEADAQNALLARAERVLGDPAAPARQWAPLAELLEPHLAGDPYWPQLAGRLAAAARAGIDVAHLTTRAAAERPLPDEMPAAALWWRLAEHLSPAVLEAAGPTAGTLRPAWTPTLTAILGEATADRILADRHWPALVAAVTAAAAAGWTAQDALHTAHDLLHGGTAAGNGTGDDSPLGSDELTRALAWHVRLLTDPGYAGAPPAPGDEPPPSEEPDTEEPEEDGTRPSAADAAWLAARTSGGTTDPTPPCAPPAHGGTVPHGPAGADPLTGRAGVSLEQAGVITAIGSAADARHAGPGQQRIWAQPEPTIAPERITELNAAALAFYTARYPRSWAADYVYDRLGADLSGDPRFTPGYAPARWTALVDHLRAAGAADTELLTAGLAARTRDGRLVDRFRDRLVLPIRHGDADTDGEAVVGFVARRPPHAGEEHGPKYLNTPDTAAFTKSDCLYGPAGALHALRGGAAPVLVEGPFDAIAVTLAAGGSHVGLAPLGTAFTDAQADRLRPHLQRGTIVATDNDPAGRAAAIRAYWRLVARGDSPAQLLLSDGFDPATLLHTAGSAVLRDALRDPRPLVEAVIDERIARYAGRLHTAEGVVAATRAAAEAIAPLPPAEWPRHLPYLTGRVDALPGAAQLELLDAAGGWDDDRQRILRRRLVERLTDAPPPDSGQAAPTQRWLPLAGRIDPRLPHDPHWAALADALDRADRSGYDITGNLPRLATHPPLPDRHAARTLHSRLAAETEAALTPPPTHRTPASTAAAEPPRPAGTPPAGGPAPHRPVPR